MEQGAISPNSEIDALRRVLDPADVTGIKNSYIDLYLKYYLRAYLHPEKGDTVLEIGSGVGRLTEYISAFVAEAYGIDLVDDFIDACRTDIRKRANTHYLKMSDLQQLKNPPIDKMFIVWVLMYLIQDDELVATLSRYRQQLPRLKSVVVIEQVKRCAQTRYSDGRLDCRYRTIEEYSDIFAAAGFRVRGHVVLGERYYGPLYRLIHILGNYLPRSLAHQADRFFRFDRKIMENRAGNARLVNDRTPTDVVFLLDAA